MTRKSARRPRRSRKDKAPFQQAELVNNQKQVAGELEQQVAQRTAELAEVNEDLRKEIGERKKIEERLREREGELQRALDQIKKSEAKLRQVVDAIPTLAWCNLPDGPNEFLNKGWHEYTGLSPEESHGWGWQVALHSEDVPSVMKKWRELLISGEPDEIEARLRRHDGVYRWFLIRAQPLRDEVGKIVRWYGTSTDIDDRKRAEHKLRESEENLRTLTDAIRQSIAVLAPDGTILFVNRVFRETTGLTMREVNDKTLHKRIFHPEDLDRVLAERRESLLRGTPFEYEARLLMNDGQYRWWLIQYNPLKDEHGHIIRWYGAGTDIEERKQAEDKLRRSEAFLAEGQHLAKMGNFSWRVAKDEITWSEQLYRIFEFEGGMPVTLELIGSRVHPDDVPIMFDMVEKARRGVDDFEYEHRLLMPDQSVKYVHMIAHGFRDKDGLLEYVGAAQDITERRLSEQALGKLRSELAYVARITSLGALTASIAHEVNQPLSGVITNAGTCLRMLSADPPNVEGALETARRMIRDGNRASDVITRLRALYGRKAISFEPMDLNAATREVISLCMSDLQRNQVIVWPELAEDLPPIAGDRIQLQQVILNLLRNASDAMSTVEDRPRELVIRTERDEEDRVRLSVKDAGVGIDSQAADRLFEAFYTTKREGMGIGLSVSRSIIEAHRGRLSATANDGPGATFSFVVPCHLVDVSASQTVGAN